MPAPRMAFGPFTFPSRLRAVARRVCCVFLVLGGALLPSLATEAEAQDRSEELVGQTVQVRLADGTQILGTLESVTATQAVVVTPGGSRFEVERSQIVSLVPARGTVEGGRFLEEDPNPTRLFFSSTARTLRQGEGYVGTYLIILPFVGVGITDRFTLAAGAPLTLGELEPFYVAPKVQLIRSERANVAIGTLHFLLDADFVDDAVGIAYGVGTFGSRDNAVTVGLGFGYTGADFNGNPVAMIGAERRLSPSTKFLTENYFLPGGTSAVLSAGVRFLGERLSADLGVAAAAEDSELVCCAPLVNFSYSFGTGR